MTLDETYDFLMQIRRKEIIIRRKAAKGTKAMPGVYHVPIVAPKQRLHSKERHAKADPEKILKWRECYHQ